MSLKTRIIFFGTEDFSAKSLEILLESGFDIAAVVTKPDFKKGRGHQLVSPVVKQIANKHDIPVWQPAKLKEIADKIQKLQPVSGVLVSYGKIIPQSVIDLFTPGIINVHPSKLPKYRGPSPIESTILNGDDETGISIMKLSAEMDAGPVYHFETHKLTGSETQSELTEKLSELGAKTLVKHLPSILSGELQPVNQDDSLATYCKLIQKSDGIIDWQKSAQEIEREIRAYQIWPGSRTKLGEIDVIITSAHVKETSISNKTGTINIVENTLEVSTSKDSLVVDCLKPLGKKEMPIQAFLSGYREKLGL